MKILTYLLFLFLSVFLPVFASTPSSPKNQEINPGNNETNKEPPTDTQRGVQGLIDINFPKGIPIRPLPMPGKARPAENETTMNLTARAAEDDLPRSNVYQILTVILAAELLGGVHNSTEVDLLCNNFKWNRYGDLGLNETMINEMLCDKNLAKIIPTSMGEVKGIVRQWLTALWVQQTYGVMAGYYDKICGIINEDGASTVDMNGKQIKGVFCGRKKKDE